MLVGSLEQRADVSSSYTLHHKSKVLKLLGFHGWPGRAALAPG